MIKTFQLISSIHLGGAENVAINLLDLESHELNFTLVEIHSSSDQFAKDKKKELLSKSVKIITLGFNLKRISLIIAPVNLFFQILKQKPDIVHSHTDLPDFVLGITLKLFKIFRINPPKIVRTIHNNELWPSHFRIGKMVESCFKEDQIIGVSESSLDAHNKLRESYKLPKSSNQQIIFNGCRIPEKIPIGIKLDSSKINMAFCGRFEFQKGVDILIDRIHEINLNYQDKIDFHFIGLGSLKEKILEAAKGNDNIFIHLPINNISDKIHEFDFLIMPSRFEGLVLISMEATLSRVPVIATRTKGLTETLPPDWALNFDLEDASSLLKLIDMIVENEIDIESLTKEAYSFVSTKYSHKKMLESYSKIFESI